MEVDEESLGPLGFKRLLKEMPVEVRRVVLREQADNLALKAKLAEAEEERDKSELERDGQAKVTRICHEHINKIEAARGALADKHWALASQVEALRGEVNKLVHGMDGDTWNRLQKEFPRVEKHLHRLNQLALATPRGEDKRAEDA